MDGRNDPHFFQTLLSNKSGVPVSAHIEAR
jgi:hypothetical protein